MATAFVREVAFSMLMRPMDADRLGAEMALPALGGEREVQPVGLGGRIEPLADQLPRRHHAPAGCENVVSVHGSLPALTDGQGASVLAAGKRTLDPRTGPLTLAFPTMHDGCGDGSL